MKNQEDLKWIKPTAGVVCFPKIKKDLRNDPEELYKLLVKKYKTFVIPGRCFEMDNKYFRLGFGGTSKELRVGLKNIKRALAEIKEN